MTNFPRRDQRVYRFICDYWTQHQYSPMRSEISRAMDLSYEAIDASLSRLQFDNLIQIVGQNKYRNIYVVEFLPHIKPADSETQMMEDILNGLKLLKEQRDRAGES